MSSLMCVKVRESDHTLIIPVSRIDCILRTDRVERDDCVKTLDGEIYECLDGSFSGSLIEYVVGGN